MRMEGLPVAQMWHEDRQLRVFQNIWLVLQRERELRSPARLSAESRQRYTQKPHPFLRGQQRCEQIEADALQHEPVDDIVGQRAAARDLAEVGVLKPRLV
jgi:hypothetical protein